MRKTKTPKSFECARCGEKTPWDEGHCVETSRNKFEEFCEDCEHSKTDTCSISKDTLDPGQQSNFILLKTEAAETMSRPPGIYRIIGRPFYTCGLVGSGFMNAGGLLFVAPLPDPDITYEISGHISRTSAKELGLYKIWRAAYKREVCRLEGEKAYEALKIINPDKDIDNSWDIKHGRGEFNLRAAERTHTRATILANPNMLRDLECDAKDEDNKGHHISGADASIWEEIQEWLDLPNDGSLPTYHRWTAFRYKGVELFAAYSNPKLQEESTSWMTLLPEPKYRGGRQGSFTACSLPIYSLISSKWEAKHAIQERSWKWKYPRVTKAVKLAEKKDRKLKVNRYHSLLRAVRELSEPTTARCYHAYENLTKRAAAKETLRLAIECGGLTQTKIAKPSSWVWSKVRAEAKTKGKAAIATDEKHRIKVLKRCQTELEELKADFQKEHEENPCLCT